MTPEEEADHIMNGPRSEDTEKLLLQLAKRMGIGDGTKQTTVLVGMKCFINSCDEKLAKARETRNIEHVINAISDLSQAIKGIWTIMSDENKERKEGLKL
jgi:hypothetical protein